MSEPKYRSLKNKRTGAVIDQVSDDDGKTWRETDTSVGDRALGEQIDAAGGIDEGPGMPRGVGDVPVQGALTSQGAFVPQAAAPARTEVPWYESLLRGAGEMASMNLGDEAAGAGAMLADTDDREYKSGRGFSAPVDEQRSSRTEGRNQYRADDAGAQGDNPLWYLAGQGAGLAGTAALPVGRAAGGATMLARAARAAPVAAGMGAIAGYGASESDEGVDQAFDALGGAEVGTVAGPIAGEVAHQVATKGAPIVRGAGNWLRGREANRVEAAHGPLAARRALEAADPESASGKYIRRQLSAGESPEALEAHARAVTDDVSAIAKHGDVIQSAETIAEKTRTAQRYMETDEVDPNSVVGHADALAAEAKQQIQDMLQGVAPGTDDYRLLKRLEKDFSEYDLQGGVQLPGNAPLPREAGARAGVMEGGVELPPYVGNEGSTMIPPARRARAGKPAAVEPEPAAEGATSDRPAISPPPPSDASYELAGNKWSRVDQLKRELQRKLKDVRFNSPEVEQLHALEERLRTSLEDPEMWGQGAAGYQQQVNRAWKDTLSLEQTRDLNPRREFMSDYRGLPSASERSFRSLPEGDLSAIHGTLERAGTPDGEQALWKLGEMADRRAKLGQALTDHIEPNPALRSRAAEQEQLAGRVRERVGQREGEARMAQAMTGAERNLPDPGLVDRALGWVMGLGEKAPGGVGTAMQIARPPGRTLGQRARVIGQLERQLEVNPSNSATRDALDRITSPIRDTGHARDAAAGTVGRLGAETGYRDDLDDALEQLQKRGKGQEIEEQIEEQLDTDPTLLGPFAQQLAQARDNGTLGVELHRLNSDETWRTKVRPALQQAR